AGFNKVITDVGPGKLNLGGCVIEVMGTYEAAIVRVTIGEYGATGFINGTVCTCTVYGDTQYFHWRVDYSTKKQTGYGQPAGCQHDAERCGAVKQ
ncbi:hypothetical protein ACQCNN_005654, partial [Escherichia coli]